MNTFGKIFRLTSFGESHGTAVGGVVDGMPAGIAINLDRVQHELDRRRPGQSAIVTPRKESDRVEVLSGLVEGVTTGTPIGFEVRNADHHSADYGNIRQTFRPSNADYTYTEKYGLRDHRGGGRSSARETIARVVAGAFARQALDQLGISIYAYTSQVGDISLDPDYRKYNPALVETNAVRCPDPETAARMYDLIDKVRREGDTIGGTVTCVVKLHARLAYAMMGINAAKGFEYGMGFDGVSNRGSMMNDAFTSDNGKIHTSTNHSGGIQGGISNGEDIYFRVAFKPVATLLRDVDTVDASGNPTVLKAKGRHDPCVLPRAVPIVEAMAAMTVLDMYLLNKTTRL